MENYTIENIKEQVISQLDTCDAMKVLKYLNTAEFVKYYEMVKSDTNVCIADMKLLIGSHLNHVLYYLRSQDETELNHDLDLGKKLAKVSINSN
ncbi:hypothetical protein C9994_07935 [Marivirga lumbricoides]|uniref:Uncharacterized protein n=1 Tax=Marivirga lumbricoides TaxID=1046115 RepID=A0A2T4DR92_9BACT|nr:hypothetical protein C9994_07935 [Marivirga lumbricoides]